MAKSGTGKFEEEGPRHTKNVKIKKCFNNF